MVTLVSWLPWKAELPIVVTELPPIVLGIFTLGFKQALLWSLIVAMSAQLRPVIVLLPSKAKQSSVMGSEDV